MSSPATNVRSTAGVAMRSAWPAVALYAVEKIVLLVAFGVAGLLPGVLLRWDAAWLLYIVDHGYTWPGHGVDGTSQLSDLAFFPLVPETTRLLSAVLHLPPGAVLVALSWGGGVAAAWGIYAVGTTVADARVAAIFVALWGVAPHSLVQVLGYTETMFTAFIAWALYLGLRRRWVGAGVLVFCAGLTRPSASAAVALFWLTALWSMRGATDRGECRRRFVGALVGSAGLAVAWLHVAWRTGSILGYVAVQRAWGTSLSTPVATVVYVRDVVLTHEQ